MSTLQKYKFCGEISIPLDRGSSRPFELVPGKFKETDDFFIGRNMLVIKPEALERLIPEIYYKYYPKKVVVKICDSYPYRISNPDYCIIQNLLFMEKLAPKNYGLVEVIIGDLICQAVVIENMDGNFPMSHGAGIRYWHDAMVVLNRYHIGFNKEDGFPANFIDGKLLDFDEWYFTDKDLYEKEMRERFDTSVVWGNGVSRGSYQEVPELGVIGGRTIERLKKLGIYDIDLTGKTVLDIGCSGGQVLFWAASRGARRVVGVDMPKVARATFEMANFHGYHQIETMGLNLEKDDPMVYLQPKFGINQFDYVFMFSVNHHIGFHDYMRKTCLDTLFLETNAAQAPDVEQKEYTETLQKLGYNSFEFKGTVQESGERSLFICK